MTNERTTNTPATTNRNATLNPWFATLTIHTITNPNTGKESTLTKYYNYICEMIPDLCDFLGTKAPARKKDFSLSDFFATYGGARVVKDPWDGWTYKAPTAESRRKPYICTGNGVAHMADIKVSDNCYISVTVHYRKSDF